MKYFHLIVILLVFAFTAGTFISPKFSAAASAAEIDRDVTSALETLYAQSASAKSLGQKAKGILVFPSIVKGGFVVGGQYGVDGATSDINPLAGPRTNPSQFNEVWKVFKPMEKVPDVDFSDHMVVFSRKVTFFNRTAIMKVMLKEGVAEILARETMSAMPIEEKVAMSMAVIPRSGVNFIAAGKKPIPVKPYDPGVVSGPMNTSYNIEGQEITLQNGHSEKAIVPGSATKIRTSIIGDVVQGDLDGDGDKDAVLILVNDPGGSGTFYYVAVAENLNGRYRGTNGVLLGDRITPKDLRIRNGLIIVRYAKRGPHEPMSTAPSVEAVSYLAFDGGNLKVLKPLGQDEHLLEGWVIIGHEVRSFHPCTQKTDYWLSRDSPALKEIMARYKKALPGARPYTPLVMVLAGRFVDAPRDGFGADYAGAFCATQILGVRPEGYCRTKAKKNHSKAGKNCRR
jgi:hypothetical protein